jgi:hypothetical protein
MLAECSILLIVMLSVVMLNVIYAECRGAHKFDSWTKFEPWNLTYFCYLNGQQNLITKSGCFGYNNELSALLAERW